MPRRNLPVATVAVVAFLVVLAALLISVADAYSIGAVVIALLLFTLPGYFVVSALAGPRLRGTPEHAIWGAIFGYAGSSLLALVVGYLGGWRLLPVATTLILASLAAYGVSIARRTPCLPRLRAVAWVPSDYLLLLSFSTVALLAVFLPFSRVGSLTPRGVAFPSLFGYDFILRVSFSAALSHGVPPVHPNFTGLHLQTYWLSYVFPGFLHMATGYRLPLQSLFIVTQVFQILAFLGAMFSVLRIFVRDKRALGLTLFLLVCAYSYYGYFGLLKSALATSLLGSLGFVRSTGVFTHLSPLSHSYYRDFLFEPQAICAISLVLLALRFIAYDRTHLRSKAVSLVIGLLAGCTFGADASIGLIFIGWYAALFALDLPQWRHDVPSAAVFLGALAGVALVFYVIGMYSLGGGSGALRLGPYLQIMVLAPGYFLLDYGPMVVFALWLVVMDWRVILRRRFLPVVVLGAIALVFVLLVRHDVEINLGLRKGMKILQIPLLVLAGLFFESVYFRARRGAFVRKAVPALIVASLVTLGVDIHATSTLTDEGNTTFVDQADYEACQWIKGHTPVGAVIQSEPEYPSVYEYSLISCFAERTMVVGQSMSGRILRVPNPVAFAEGRKRDVRLMLSTPDVSEALRVINRYGIGYVYVGGLEKKLYGPGLAKFERETGTFGKVYSKNQVDIYRVLAPRSP